MDSSQSLNENPRQQDEGIDENNMTALQKHVAFFDRNKDGIIYPWETYKGFRAVGFGFPRSLAAGVLIHLAMSYSTLPGRIPSLLFPIYIKNIKRAKHGSDSGVYDSEGRFVPDKFEAIFSKYALTHSEMLTKAEMDSMVKANRIPKDFFGQTLAKAEWGILYDLAKDENGLLEKAAIRGAYDGSLFEFLEKKNASRNQN